MTTLTTLKAYLDDVEVMLRSGSTTKAITHCRHILQHYPQNVQAYRLLARALLDRGERDGMPEFLDEAVEVFQRVLGVLPSDYDAHAGLGRIHLRQGVLTRAIWHLERAVEQRPGDVEVRELLRGLLSRQLRVEVQSSLQVTRATLARQYMAAQLHDQALIELRAALEEAPDRADVQLMLVQSLWETGRQTEAAERATKLLARLPYCLGANAILARFWMAHERPSDAQLFLDRIEVTDPYAAASVLGTDGEAVDRSTLPRLDYDLQTMAAVSAETPEWMRELEADDLAASQGEDRHGVGAQNQPASPFGEWDASPAEAAFFAFGGANPEGAPDIPFPDLDASWLDGPLTPETVDQDISAESMFPSPDWGVNVPPSPSSEPLPPDWISEDASVADSGLPDLQELLSSSEVEGSSDSGPGSQWFTGPGEQAAMANDINSWVDDANGWPDAERRDAAIQDILGTGTQGNGSTDPLREEETASSGAELDLPWEVSSETPENIADHADGARADGPWASQAELHAGDWILEEDLHVAGHEDGLWIDPAPVDHSIESGPRGSDVTPWDATPPAQDSAAHSMPDTPLEEPPWDVPSLDSPDSGGSRPEGASFRGKDLLAGWGEDQEEAALSPEVGATDWLAQPEYDFFAPDDGPISPADEGVGRSLGLDDLAPEWLPEVGELTHRSWDEQQPPDRAETPNDWLSALSEVDETGLEELLMMPDTRYNADHGGDDVPEPTESQQEPLRPPDDSGSRPDPATATGPGFPIGDEDGGPVDSILPEWLGTGPELDRHADAILEENVLEHALGFDSSVSDEAHGSVVPGAEEIAEDMGWLRSEEESEDDWLAGLEAAGSSTGARTEATELIEPDVSIEAILAAAAANEWPPAAREEEPIDLNLSTPSSRHADQVDTDVVAGNPSDEWTAHEAPVSQAMSVPDQDWVPDDSEKERDSYDGAPPLQEHDAVAWDRPVDAQVGALGIAEPEPEIEVTPELVEEWPPTGAVSASEDELMSTLEQERDTMPWAEPDRANAYSAYSSAGVTGILQPDEAPDWMTAFTGEELPPEIEEDLSADRPAAGVAEESEREPSVAEVLDDLSHAPVDAETAEDVDLEDEVESEGVMPDWLLAITQSESDKLENELFAEADSYAHGEATGVLQPDQEPDWLAGVRNHTEDEALEGRAVESVEHAAMNEDSEVTAPDGGVFDASELGVGPEDAVTFRHEESGEIRLDAADFAESEQLVEFDVDVIETETTDVWVAEQDVLPHTIEVQDGIDDEPGADDFSLDDVVPVWLRQPKEIGDSVVLQSEPWTEAAQQSPEWLRDVFEDDEDTQLDS